MATSAAHSDDLLHAATVNALDPSDRNLVTTLVLGVLRWQLYLDVLLHPMLQRPDAELHPSVLLALRLGIFQLRFLDRIPPHAAVNESVELARANGAAHAAGMVNAVLRRVLRERDGSGATERQTLAVARTPAEQAHPDWLLARWRKRFGMAGTRRIAEHDQAEPPSGMLFAVDPQLPLIDDGSRLVAELAAASVEKPRRILDCCAAPGGKTAVLAHRHPEAEIVAVDVSERRISAMRKRLDRDPVTARVQTVLADMTAQPSAPGLDGGFDLILCDAPCSGTGTLARNPEIRQRLREGDLPRQAERQRAILASACGMLAPGGRIVYSTCSLEPEESEGVVTAVLGAGGGVERHPVEEIVRNMHDLSGESRELLMTTAIVDGSLRTVPGMHPCDGFYAALLVRPT